MSSASAQLLQKSMKVNLQRSRRLSRKERIIAQYDNSKAAADYVRAHEGPEGRFFRSRLRLVQKILASCSGGDLLDAGCGPGIMVRALLESRPNDFRITALDQSEEMVKYCAARTYNVSKVHPLVGQLEAMPFADSSFEVVLLMGALEYSNAHLAIREVSRVTRPGGLVIVTMLNPLSPYRLTEWFLYQPSIRLLGAIERSCGVPAEQRHGACRTGIHAYPVPILRRLMIQTRLQPIDIIYFDVTPTVLPFDRLPRMRHRTVQFAHDRSVIRGWRRWMGTAYLIVARRS